MKVPNAVYPPAGKSVKLSFFFTDTEGMFFVMVEISNYRQLSRLRMSEAEEIRGLLEHFCRNRGGRLAREQNGFFLFGFHPLREKVLDHVSDFLFLTAESLQKKRDDLFGFSLLLDQDDETDETLVFNRLKALVFLAPRENRVWAGPGALALLSSLFPVKIEEPLSEILGPPVASSLPPLPVESLLEMTGWIEALKTPLSRQLSGALEGKPGKILRLKGAHLTEKYFVLKTVLHQIYGPQKDFPVFFPLEESRDFLSQLLARIDPLLMKEGPPPADASWGSLLSGTSGGDYPGDSGREDVVGALTAYFRALIHHWTSLGLPPVFVFLFPHRYEPDAQAVLEAILAELVSRDGLRLLLLEPQDRSLEFLSRQVSLSWSFPPLVLDRILKERDSRGWKERFPVLGKETLEACGGRGMAWVHYLWSLQAKKSLPQPSEQADPSWALLTSLDSSHLKVYFVLGSSRGLLDEDQLVGFFQYRGEDPAVITDKVRNLRAMGFLVGGLSQTLRPDFIPRLAAVLGEEGKEVLVGLGHYLHRAWTRNRRFSEVLFGYLRDHGLHATSSEVLATYLTNKIDQGTRDFLSFLRPRLWTQLPTEELQDTFRLIAASAKLRYALNLPGVPWPSQAIERYRRFFSVRTEDRPSGEWLLQTGRYHLRMGDLNTGFALLKKALLHAQDRDDRSLEVRSESEIGLTLLRKHKTEEAGEYFDIASRLAEKTGSPYLVALTSGLEATGLFLLGYLTGARKALVRGLAAADRGGLQHRKVFLTFLRARIDFDQGNYSTASETLEQARALAQRYRFRSAEAVLTAWQGRAESFGGHLAVGRTLLERLDPSGEQGYFLAENFYLDENWDAAWTHISQARTRLRPTQAFGLGEQVEWTSGFSGLEDRALSKPGDLGVLENQIDAFQGMLEGVRGDPEAAGHRFQALLARKTLLDLDPAAAQYYYWYYLTISRTDGSQEAQRLTLLGRCLKAAQLRASRIEDPAQRHDFLLKPYWNSRFSQEGRKLKLL